MKPKYEEKWYLVDAKGKILGRIATKIATILNGKKRPNFSPAVNFPDFVVVINAEKVAVTGKKEKQKVYRWHSGYLGGLKEMTLEEMRKKKPTEIIRRAVWNMLPKNKLRKKRIKRLKIFAGNDHPFSDKKLIKIE